jgi:hypothetical protein
VLTKESRYCRYAFCLDPAFHFLVTASHFDVCKTSTSFIKFLLEISSLFPKFVFSSNHPTEGEVIRLPVK